MAGTFGSIIFFGSETCEDLKDLCAEVARIASAEHAMAKRVNEGGHNPRLHDIAAPKRQASSSSVLIIPRPGDIWSTYPQLSYLSGLTVSDETKVQIERLWKMLDVNGDGTLSAEDWEATPGGGGKWDLLKKHFDLTGSNVVAPPEFVERLKSLAMEKPLDPECFSKIPSDHHECVEWLTQSANNKIQDLCKELFDEMSNKDSEIWLFPETTKQIDQLWKILDVNGDGTLTAEDWQHSPGGASKWDLLRSKFDLDGSGGVEPQEFMTGLKNMALVLPIEVECFIPQPTTHVEMMKCVNESTNRQIQNLCKELFETISGLKR